MRKQTTDRDIRAVLKQQLHAQYVDDPATLILDELGLRHGKARIDVVVINGIIHGFEIKSATDTLKRLPGQVSVFNTVLDRVTLVVAHRHTDKARQMIPKWWGVAAVKDDGLQPLRFTEVRKGGMNPSPDPLAVAKLLWRDEAMEVLEKKGAAKGIRSKPRKYLYERLIVELALDDLRREVRERLLSRRNWRPDERRM